MLLIFLVNMHALFLSPSKDKIGITTTNAFQKILDESNRKPNNIWIDKSSEFYNRSMKLWLKKCSRNVFNTQQRMKLSHDVKASIYTDSSKENNGKDPKFEIDDIVRISIYKNIFAKECSKLV